MIDTKLGLLLNRARKAVVIDGEFPMHLGGRLLNPIIAYETWGELSSQRDNAILIFTGLSPSAHAASSAEDMEPGWWEGMIGPGRAIDTRRFFVICVNSLGSCFGSTGATSINSETGQPYRSRFPALSLEDVGRGGREVIRHLGIEKLYATVGPSMGGMSALAFEMLFPGLSQRLLLLSAATHSLPFATALRSLQREMICCDPNWSNGNYSAEIFPLTGMRLARKLGMITYRSADEWAERFGRERIGEDFSEVDPFAVTFEIEAYLEHHANKFIGQFDPNCYLYLSRASDLFDVADHGASVAKAIEKIKVSRAMVVGVVSDILYPLHQQNELANLLAQGEREVEFVELPSIQGHDSFLVDMDNFCPAVARFFDN